MNTNNLEYFNERSYRPDWLNAECDEQSHDHECTIQAPISSYATS